MQVLHDHVLITCFKVRYATLAVDVLVSIWCTIHIKVLVVIDNALYIYTREIHDKQKKCEEQISTS